jgi:high affinity sulfate transporter 1
MSVQAQAEQKPKSGLKSFIPILEWLPKYDKSWIRFDVIAALTVWALLVPEGMAYAGIAGMPPETGLYAALLALVGYAIFGTSKHLNVGPSSTVAALSFAVVAPLAAAGSDDFINLTITLALLTGLVLIISGLLRLGVLADFLSKPVLGGFVIGLAISIAVGQLDKVLGYEAEVPVLNFIPDLLAIIADLGMTHLPTLIVGAVSLALLFLMHKYTPKIPAAIVVVFLAIILSAIFDFESLGIHIVGEIPAGLPDLGLPTGIEMGDILVLLPGAIAIALVAFAESLAAARSYATKYGYEINANQEMLALGAANVGSGFSQAFAVDGSLSRSAAGDGAGSKSQMASIFLAVFVFITVLFLTPLFRTLPEATLGAVVIHAVWHLIDFKKLQGYYRIKRIDFWAALVAMVGVLMLGILQGLILAIFLSLLGLLAAAKNPATAVLGKAPDENVYHNLEHYPDGVTYPGLIIFRFDDQLFFANAPNFQQHIRELVAADPAAHWVLIDAESMNDIDITGTDMLGELHDELARANIQLHFARMKEHVFEIIQRAGVEEAIGSDHFHLSVQIGVDTYLAAQQETSPDAQP